MPFLPYTGCRAGSILKVKYFATSTKKRMTYPQVFSENKCNLTLHIVDSCLQKSLVMKVDYVAKVIRWKISAVLFLLCHQTKYKFFWFPDLVHYLNAINKLTNIFVLLHFKYRQHYGKQCFLEWGSQAACRLLLSKWYSVLFTTNSLKKIWVLETIYFHPGT